MSKEQTKKEHLVTENGDYWIRDGLLMQLSTEGKHHLRYSVLMSFMEKGSYSGLITIPYSELRHSDKRLKRELENCSMTFDLDDKIIKIIHNTCLEYMEKRLEYCDCSEESLEGILQIIFDECHEIKLKDADDIAFTIGTDKNYCNISTTHLDELFKQFGDMKSLPFKRWLKNTKLICTNSLRPYDRKVTVPGVLAKNGQKAQCRCVSIKLDRAEQLGFDVSRLRPEYWEGK